MWNGTRPVSGAGWMVVLVLVTADVCSCSSKAPSPPATVTPAPPTPAASVTPVKAAADTGTGDTAGIEADTQTPNGFPQTFDMPDMSTRPLDQKCPSDIVLRADGSFVHYLRDEHVLSGLYDKGTGRILLHYANGDTLAAVFTGTEIKVPQGSGYDVYSVLASSEFPTALAGHYVGGKDTLDLGTDGLFTASLIDDPGMPAGSGPSTYAGRWRAEDLGTRQSLLLYSGSGQLRGFFNTHQPATPQTLCINTWPRNLQNGQADRWFHSDTPKP